MRQTAMRLRWKCRIIAGRMIAVEKRAWHRLARNRRDHI
jgi:hypothetical protein